MLQEILRTGATGWLAAISENFQLRSYLFDSRLRRTMDFSDLGFEGKATALGATLRTLADRYRGRPLAGILLLTDGCATDAGASFYDLAGVPPVYPVVIGRGLPPQDLALANVSVSQTSFEDAPVTIQTEVEATGFAGRTARVDLLGDGGNLIEHQQWKVDRSDEKQTVRFRLRPDRTGVLFYRLRVTAQTAAEESGAEATLANNEQTVVVNRGKGLSILYVAGRPNWDRSSSRGIEG
jgi:hypothetical protein